MSTVYWSNSLIGDTVSSDNEDLYALNKHTKKLDALCKKVGLQAISSFIDSTDMLVNLEQLDMPSGMESTDELMAAQGNWVDAQLAADVLEQLCEHVKTNEVRFGLVSDARGDVIEELELCAKFARAAAEKGGKFNFAIVM